MQKRSKEIFFLNLAVSERSARASSFAFSKNSAIAGIFNCEAILGSYKRDASAQGPDFQVVKPCFSENENNHQFIT